MADPVTFAHTGEDWSAMLAAEAYIRERGWSVGSSDRLGVRGIIFEPGVAIAKWHNLNAAQRDECDARLEGRGRDADRVLFIQRAG